MALVKTSAPGALHSAGAAVRHGSPFSSLATPEPRVAQESLPEWSLRLFNVGLWTVPEALDLVGPNLSLVTPELVETLLSVFNWRPRVIGSHLAAVLEFRSVEQHIGHLLLRSDVCFAGAAYSLCLARFDSNTSRSFLVEYLEYYLRKPDLWFDQGYAMAAVLVLDERNGTSLGEPLRPLWDSFVRNKPQWRLESYVDRLRSSLDGLLALPPA
jgi:hypothetical protein